MSIIKTDAINTAPPEPESDRKRRIAREALMVAQAEASIAAGRVVDENEVDAWIDSIGTAHELPAPKSGR